MFLSSLAKSFLVVLSISCVAQAYLIPGAPGAEPVQYQPGYGGGHGGDNGGWVDPGSGVDPSPYDPQPGYPGNNPGYGDHDVRSAWIQRNVTNERLPLRELTGLDSFYRGWEVLSVRANTRPNNAGRTIVQLVADGRIIATQYNPGYQINLNPQVRLILGQTVRNLQLVVNGSTYIEDIQVEVLSQQNGLPPLPPPNEPPPYPGNPGYPGQPGNGQQRVDINVYQNISGNDRIDLTRYIDLSRYRGLAIEQVIIQGTANYDTAFINLIINGNNMGQTSFSGSYSQSQSVWLSQRPVIGRGADSIVLYSSGSMTVERVTLVLSY